MVCGGGPAGYLARCVVLLLRSERPHACHQRRLVSAMFLAQQGYSVQLFEQRENRDKEYSVTPPRSFFYSLGPRAQRSLTAVGCTCVLIAAAAGELDQMQHVSQAGVQLPEKAGERLGGLTRVHPRTCWTPQ